MNKYKRKKRREERQRLEGNPYLLDFQQVWERVKSAHRWFGRGGLRGWFAWQYTWLLRLYIVLLGSRRIKDRYGFAIPNEEALNRLSRFRHLIEMGAGKGYWARMLRHRGVDILPFDKCPIPGMGGSWHTAGECNWTDVLEGDPSILPKYPERVLLLCYPPKDNSMGSDALAQYQGDTLAYIGTSQSLAVGDALFHSKLDTEWDLIEAVPIPGWLDFSYPTRSRIPRGYRWRDIALSRTNYGNNLFIFKRK